MLWKNLLSPYRAGTGKVVELTPARSPFQQDFDRIVFSGSFRRMQDKTQVFPLSRTDYVRTRLTHSMEVGSIARSLGRAAGGFICRNFETGGADSADMGAIVAAAALAHDIGNPPLGHSGEEAIRHWFTHSPAAEELRQSMTAAEAADIERYDGNAQGFRVLTHLEMPDRPGGMQLTAPTLATLTKYPATAIGKLKKFNFFRTELSVFAEVAEACGLEQTGPEEWQRHPLSFLLEAADDIAYLIVDFEDAQRVGLVPYEVVEKHFTEILLTGDEEEKIWRKELSCITSPVLRVEFLRARVIGVLVRQAAKAFELRHEELISGKMTGQLLDNLPCRDTLAGIRRISLNDVYNNRAIAEVVAAGFELVTGLLDIFVPCHEELAKERFAGIPAGYRSKRLGALLPPLTDDENSRDPYRRLLHILDYLSGMTDSFALSLFQKLKGISL